MTDRSDVTTTPAMASDETGGGAFGFVREGYGRAEIQDLNTAELESATVYGRGGETIGSISSLMVDTDGTITAVVLEVGGFLGVGAHSVLVSFEELTVLRETDGSEMSVHLDTTKDKLKAMPHHAG